ncbi:MAG TPA: TIR domain-containing protein [Desulfobacteria bacterium]|nr:TIR domain-containing protein [Desulfobacteria bacterium]
MVTTKRKKQIFISYAHKDKEWLDCLKVFLTRLEKDSQIDMWEDSKIKAGEDWVREIENALRNVDAAILLISEDFLASDFISSNELPRLLSAAEKKGLKILSIILKPSSFLKQKQISKYQTINDTKKPLSTLSEAEQDEIFRKAADIIEEMFIDHEDTIKKQMVNEPIKEGVRELAKDRIIHRTKEQLNPQCKLLKSSNSVIKASKNLAEKIRKDGFVPDIIVGWRHADNKKYEGSNVVSELLAKNLKIEKAQIDIKEVGEKRVFLKSYDWASNVSKIIVADDACYTGKTLEAIKRGLLICNQKLEIRFAVLSKKVDYHIKDIYYVFTHDTEDLLFPWGWSRSISKFQEIHELFGISDWRFFNRIENKWGFIDSVCAELLSGVRIFSIKKKQILVVAP